MSEDDRGVQSPPQQSLYDPLPFSEGDWISRESVGLRHIFFLNRHV